MPRRSKASLLRLRKHIVLEHIDAIMDMAINLATSGNIELAEKMAAFARKLARWTGVRMKRRWKYFFCKKCKSFIMPGITARVRIRQNRYPHITIFCMKCKNYRRIPLKKKERKNQNVSLRSP